VPGGNTDSFPVVRSQRLVATATDRQRVEAVIRRRVRSHGLCRSDILTAAELIDATDVPADSQGQESHSPRSAARASTQIGLRT